MTTTRILSFTMIALLSMALVACGDETTTDTGLTCGEGTSDESGVCVPSETVGDLACGEGTVQDGSECVPDTGATVPTCGPGTKEIDGVCELDPDATPVALTCGEGTTEVDGECVADVTPADPLAVSALGVAGFELKGPYASAPTALRSGFPVSLWATITAESNAPFQTQVLFGLSQGTNAEGEEESGEDCLLGSRTLYHPGTNAEVIVGGEFVIPSYCLDQAEITDDGAVMYPFILVDADNELGLGGADGDALQQFFLMAPGAEEATAFQACSSGSSADGSCAVELLVRESDGVDFSVKSASTASSVIVLGDPESGVTVNKDGEMVYGFPELQLDTTVVAYGTEGFDEDLEPLNLLEDNDLEFRYYIQPLGETDSWQPLYLHTEGDPAKADPAEGGVDSYEVALETHLVASAPMEVRHGLYVEDHCGTLCGDPKCTNNESCTDGGYCLLDPALGSDPATGGCDATKHARLLIMHGAWRENVDFVVRACIESVEETASPDEVGDDLPNCADTTVKILRADDPSKLGIIDDEEAADESGGWNWSKGKDAGDTKGEGTDLEAEYGLSVWGIGDSAGLRFQAEADAEVRSNSYGIDLKLARAWYNAGALVTITDSGTDWGMQLLGFDLAGEVNHLDDAGKSCSKDDHCKSLSCELSDGQKVCDPGVVLRFAEPFEMEEEWEFDWNGWAWVIPYTISFEAEIETGVTADISLTAEPKQGGSGWPIDLPGPEPDTSIWGESDGYWDDALTVGALWAGVTATNEASMTLQLGIGNSDYGVNGGVGGDLKIWELSLPAGARLAWGAVNPEGGGDDPANQVYQGLKMRLDVGAWTQLKLLQGTIYLYIDAQSDPCWGSYSKKTWFGTVTVKYPKLCWEQIYYHEIASFSLAAPLSWTLFSLTDCSIWDGEDNCPRFDKCLGNCDPSPEASNSCKGYCGDEITTSDGVCSCSHSCLKNGDCCEDKYDFCPLPVLHSCKEHSQCGTGKCKSKKWWGKICWW